MPSPLNGFTEPAASPTTSQVGPTLGADDPPVGSIPPVGAPHDVSGEMSQRGGRGGDERVHQGAGVDLLPPGERRQQADTDVHRAVAHGEHPAVARQVAPLPVVQVEVALDPRLVVEGAGEVAADRHAERVRAVAHGADRAPEPGVRAVGHHEVLRAHRLGRAVALDRGARHQPVLDQRGDGLGARPQRGADLHRALGHHLVEVAAPNHISVRREVGMFGPTELQGHAVRDRSQAVEAQELLERLGEAHVVQLADGPRREPVATGLLAGNCFLSTTSTRWPASASQCAVAAPEGPAPTTNTSQVGVVIADPACALVIPRARLEARGRTLHVCIVARCRRARLTDDRPTTPRWVMGSDSVIGSCRNLRSAPEPGGPGARCPISSRTGCHGCGLLVD